MCIRDSYSLTRKLAKQILADEPFDEPAWRLMMRVANILGDDKGVLRAFHECERSLASLGTEPSASTRELLVALRR